MAEKRRRTARVSVRFMGSITNFFFQDHVVMLARNLGLVGFVTMELDSGGLIVLEGKRLDLRTFMKLIRKDFPHGRMWYLGWQWSAPTGEFSHFMARRGTSGVEWELLGFTAEMMRPEVRNRLLDPPGSRKTKVVPFAMLGKMPKDAG